MTARLSMEGMRKAFGATVALDGVDFVVAPGEILALVGENGAGKSTLMKILAGAVRPDAGRMRLHGGSFHPRDPLAARRAGIAMIHQELSLAPHLSVQQNITLGMEPTRFGLVDGRAMRRRAEEALGRLAHAEIAPTTRVDRLTPAQRQVVEVARALEIAGEAGGGVIVLDEPTSSLTTEDAQRLFSVVRALREQQQAVIYISHFIEEVMGLADRYTVLRDGKSVATGRIAETDENEIVRAMVGRSIERLYPTENRDPGEEVLTVEGLAGAEKPTDAGFSLRRGEVLGIAGLVGAGRTEMLRALFGLDRVLSGAIRFRSDTGAADPARRWTTGMGMVSEDRKAEGLLLNRSAADNLTLSRLEGLGPGPLVLPRRQQVACAPLLEKLDIRCRDAWQQAGQLSGGNQQKLAIGRLLHHDVSVLLLDEPTRGVDVGSKARIYALIDEMARAGKAVLLVSSYMLELLGLCDRIAVMHRGRLGPARPTAEWDEDALMREASGAQAA